MHYFFKYFVWKINYLSFKYINAFFTKWGEGGRGRDDTKLGFLQNGRQ